MQYVSYMASSTTRVPLPMMPTPSPSTHARPLLFHLREDLHARDMSLFMPVP